MENFKKEDLNEDLKTPPLRETNNNDLDLEKEKKAKKRAKKIESAFRSFLVFVIALLVVLLINCWQTKREVMLMSNFNNCQSGPILESDIPVEEEEKEELKIDETGVLSFYNCVEASRVDNRYFFIDGEDVKECFTPSDKSFIEEDLIKAALNARLEELSISCSVDARGTWLPYRQECEHSDRDWCTRQGGEFHSCVSECRYEEAFSNCSDECISVCTFDI